MDALIITRGTKEAHSVLVTEEPDLILFSALLLSRSLLTGVAMLKGAFG